MYATTFEFPLCCGTKVIGDFRESKVRYDYESIPLFSCYTGIGYAVSTFNNEDEQKQAYEEMKNKFKIAWESGWIPNANMSNDTQVNLVVFETEVCEVD